MPLRLLPLLERFQNTPITLVGDVMLDRYLYGNAERLSPEAPVPVLHYQHEQSRLGGAGGVAANLAALGAQVRLLGCVGQDPAAAELRRLLAERQIDDGYLRCVADRPTTCKTRLVGLAQHRHPQQMLRIDYECPTAIGQEDQAALLRSAAQAMEGSAALCIEDYNKGTLSDEMCQALISLARRRDIPVLIDPAAITDYRRYRGASALKLNRLEAAKATGLPMETEAQWFAAAERLLDTLDLQAVIISLDKRGAVLATRDQRPEHLPTRPRQVYDVTGAGDMVLAAVTLCRAAGGSWRDAVLLGNLAGGLEVERFGSVPITRQELAADILTASAGEGGKIRTSEQLLAQLAAHRAAGKKIVFTNGCFDLIHLGHVEYFRFAKRQGDVLVVGVNTDAGIRRLKGDKRPIVSQADRLSVLEELCSIDYLVLFDDDTPLALIDALSPDVLVKGADYRRDQVVGADLVESRGGRVALAPLIDGRSTSGVIRRILDAYGDGDRR